MTFSPSDISGLKIWLKADAGAGASDNDPVGTWSDQSGTSHDFTQATSGKKPTYKTNIQNGLPVVRFDGTDDEMSGGDLSAVFTSAASMFCVVNPTGATGKWMAYKTKNTDNHWRYFSGEGYWGAFRSSRLGNTPSSGLPLNGWHCWSLTANGTAYKVWQDATNKINSGSFTFDGGNNHNLARQETDGYFTAMDMGELIVYDSALSDTDRHQVEVYLGQRWAITLPYVTGVTLTTTPSQPAGSVSFTQSVQGVTLTTTPSLPAGSLRTRVLGIALSRVPDFPQGHVVGNVLTGVALSATPSLPAGTVRFTRIYGVALSTTPTQPAGFVVYDIAVTGVVLTTVPSLPIGKLVYIHNPTPGIDTSEVWTIDLYDEDG